MSDARPGRAPRRYLVISEGNAVLAVEDRPGFLRSMAPPPEDWTPPTHPFVDAASLDPTTEDELRTILLDSASFADFMARLVAAGFDVMSASNDTWSLPPARRILDGARVVGALWAQGGQYASLAWQPGEGDDVYAHATLTAYAEDQADGLLGALAATRTSAELEGALRGMGLTLSA